MFFNETGIGFQIVDTAGIRSTEDRVEQIGVSKARTEAEGADLILYVVDGSVPLDENDAQIMELLRGRKTILLLNKSDLETVISKEDFKYFADKYAPGYIVKEF